jgi:alpha-galactosidase
MNKLPLPLLATALLMSVLPLHADSPSTTPDMSKRVTEQGTPIIGLATRDFKMDYTVNKDGTLELLGVTAQAGGWSSPLHGPVFLGKPGTSNGNGPRYQGPVSLLPADGDPGLELIYDSHTTVQDAPGIEHLTFIMRDRVRPIRLELHLRAYAAENIIEQCIVVRNGTNRPLKVQRLDSAYWPGTAKAGLFLEWYDNHQGSEAGRPEVEKLAKGERVLESRDGNRHIEGPVPAFVLGFGNVPDEDKTPCMVAALSWSGSARMAFDINTNQNLEASVGVNQPGQPTIEPGQSLASPACVYVFSTAGKGPASRDFHRWMRRYGLRDGDRLRLVDNNSWEGCRMNVSETAVSEMMRLSAKLGIELYVMDDGWFGNGDTARTSDNSGLGDWQINPQRFPNGLSPLIQVGKENNIAFGIWFEPEMINPKSELFKKHPDWVMRAPGRELNLQRNQTVLDVANPEVQDFMFHAVSDLLKAAPGIRFVKWDCNANINNPYSPFLKPDRQGDMLNRYLAGYYGVLAKLVTAYPQVDFQACAAGGGRADIGAMKFSHTFWPSDNTNPAYRLGAIWNFTTVLPALAATCHVTHAGGKGFLPKYRFDVAMLGQLGLEIDPRTAEPDYLAAAKVGIAAYKTVRPVVQLGDQYRHANPAGSSTPSVNYVSADQERTLVLAYQTGDLKQPLTISSPVSGLDPQRTYRVGEINLPPGDEQPRLVANCPTLQTGREWMDRGVPLVFTRRYDSAAITLEAVKPGK